MFKRIIAEVYMPNARHWSDCWTEDGDTHVVFFGRTKKDAELVGSYCYDYGFEEWKVFVTVREARPRERVSSRAFHHGWLLESIKKHGNITVKKECV